MVIALFIGLALGFFGSVPVAGPIAVLVFAYGLEGRFRSAVFLSIGAAVAEAIYACAAFWGVGTLLERYPSVVPACNGVAAALLIALGIALIRRQPSEAEEKKPDDGEGRAFSLGFTIAILNPTFLATWSAVMAALYGAGVMTHGTAMAAPFAVGVFAGIVAWFSLLVYLVKRFAGRFTRQSLDRFVKAMGVFLLVIGAWFLFELIRYLVSL
jgi:threonine/homoserine/homoserine lactone efflux protein